MFGFFFLNAPPAMLGQAPAAHSGLVAGTEVSRTYVPWKGDLDALQRATNNPTEFILEFNGFPALERSAFQYAADIWAAEIFSSFPITIEAHFEPLGAGVLATNTPVMVTGVSSGPVSSASYSIAYANAESGCDQDPGNADMIIRINDAINWHTDPFSSPGPTQYDLITVVLNQIAHGLGVNTIFAYDDGTAPDECPFGPTNSGCYPFGGSFTIFDTYIQNFAGTNLSLQVNSSPAMGAQMISDNLFWNGIHATAANGGTRPKLHSVNPFVTGESLIHLDETTFPGADPNSLLTPIINLAEVIHDPGDILRGIMKDMGWTLTDVTQAYFGVDNIAQTNQVLVFADRSTGASSWEWDFNNDAVIDATVQNPAHAYSSPGTYTATLTINGNPALTHTEVIEVFDALAFPFFLDFESGTEGFFNPVEGCEKWELGNAGTGIFAGGGGAVGGSGQSWTTNLTANHSDNMEYILQTPPVNFQGAYGDYLLRFQYRWATQNPSGMNVKYSIDGGNNWSVLGGLQGTDPEAFVGWYNTPSVAVLNGEPGWQSNFVGSTDNWVTYRINLLKGNPDVRFRIHFATGNGTNFDGIQIDNFEIDGAVLDGSIDPDMVANEKAAPLLSPSPFSEVLQLQVQSDGLSQGELRLFSLSGQLIFRQAYQWEERLEQEIRLPDIASGVYLYEWVQSGAVQRGKVVKQ
ncbi:MAG: PKD domain-containing protein [Bacteroidota bacterium]